MILHEFQGQRDTPLSLKFNIFRKLGTYKGELIMENIEIKTDVIQMDQLLKWAGIIESGGQMKFMIEDQVIKLNHVLVTEKRKKVFPGDILEINGVGTWKVVKVQGE